MRTKTEASSTRSRLLEAATVLMLEKGFAATSVDEVCVRARLTKGAFFHHFEDKADLAGALVERWSEARKAGHARLFGSHEDPLRRVLDYADGVGRLAEDGSLLKGCLIATFAQELQGVPSVRMACERGLADWVDQLGREVALTKERHRPGTRLDPTVTAEAFVAHIAGAILFARTGSGAAPIRRAVEKFKREMRREFEG